MQQKTKTLCLLLVFAAGILLGHLLCGSGQTNSSQPRSGSAFLIPSGRPAPILSAQTGTEDRGSIPKGRLDSLEEIETLLDEIRLKTKSAGSLADARICAWEGVCGMNIKTLEALCTYSGPSYVGEGVLECMGKRLGEIAPEKAAAVWLKDTHSGWDREYLLIPWIAKDPVGFAAWLGAQSAEVRRDAARPLRAMNLKPEVLAAMLKQTPDLISNEVLSGEIAAGAMNSSQKSAVQSTLGENPELTTESRAEYAEKVISVVRGLPEAPARNGALAKLAGDENFDFSRYPDIVTALAALPDHKLPTLALARHADQLPEGRLRDLGMRSKFESEAARDAVAAAGHLNEIAGTQDYPNAVQGFVAATAKDDPQTALDWAFSIPSGDQRGNALETAAREFFLQKPEEARAWLKQAPLTEAEYFRLTGRKR